MTQATTDTQKMCIDRYLEEKIDLDYWWMDAGWYVCPDAQGNPSWFLTGTWEVDSKRFPHGLREISDHAHARGLKVLVWFEPERMSAGSALAREHRDWILATDEELSRGFGLLNMGNPEALAWATEHFCGLLREQGIDLYRQDFNIDPLVAWRRNDAPDRQGMTELRHVVGHLAYFDELRRRNHNMLIDTCAGGGRRMDVETLRRAVPLWRTDHAYDPASHQGMTAGLSLWVPFHGTGMVGCENPGYYGSGPTPLTPYCFWSTVQPSVVLPLDIRERGNDYALLRKLLADWRAISANYYGDFYPLVEPNTTEDLWQAWQFNRPAAGQGMVQVFRRKGSPYVSASFCLRGLDAAATYDFTELNTGATLRIAGAELLEKGLPVTLQERPAAAVFAYQRG
jgi:alpha-galactosidase